MEAIANIRKARELLRAEVKKNLKFPRILGFKKLVDCSPTLREQEVKLDRRYFHNIFKLEEKLGEGASGCVYRCTEIKSGNNYAVKVLQGDAEFIRIVKQTYQTLKRFDHETIIKGKYCFIDENTEQIYLVMEHCKFPSLAKIMQQRGLSSNEAKAMITALLETVALIHQSAVCHRDLKPDNVLYDVETNRIKLIDFGISKSMYNRRTGENESMWTVTGTQFYKAPEMLNGSAYDEKVDVWAVGVIAYQILFDRLPFQSEYVSQTIDMILSEEPDYTSTKVNAVDVDFLKALLRKDPKNRLNCSQALRHPWVQNHIRYKKSDQLSSSTYTFTRQETFTRRVSPTICMNQPNISKENQLNRSDLQLEGGIIQVTKQIVLGDWLQLRKRSSSHLYPSSASGSPKSSVGSDHYQMSMDQSDE